MKRTVKLDDLFGTEEKYATFHDASLLALQVDYGTTTLTAEFDVCVGKPNADERADRERHRRGKLHVSGLILWALSPPSVLEPHPEGPLWLASHVLLKEAPTGGGKQLAKNLGDDLIAAYWFFNDLNSFAYCFAQGAKFEWL